MPVRLLERRYTELLEQGSNGVDLVAPAGLAWQVARDAAPPSPDCLAKVDPQYEAVAAGQAAYLDVMRQGGQCCGVAAADKIASGEPCTDRSLKLYRDIGPDYHSHYCTTDAHGHTDHHPSLRGMYLNALVMYATLFGKSPVGAAWPDGQVIDGNALPLAVRPGAPELMNADDAAALQRIAEAVVLGADGERRAAWTRSGR
eukprot:COSAG06_NODE_2749_length_6349_cov_6.086400_5_plen_201_part_00